MKSFIALLFACLALHVQSQNVGINASGATPAASAMLDVTSSNKGLLIPNVALTGTGDVTTISSPATSLLIYNTATTGSGATAVSPGFYYFNGTKWIAFGGTNGKDWSLTGNAGTTANTSTATVNNNFIGTTDGKDFVVATNNAEVARFLSTGTENLVVNSPTAASNDIFSAYTDVTAANAVAGYNTFSGTTGGNGVYGNTTADNGNGVKGKSVTTTTSTAVIPTGLFGQAAAAHGIGALGTNSNATGTGVAGANNGLGSLVPTGGAGGSFYGDIYGVYGQANTTTTFSGAAVYGRSNTGSGSDFSGTNCRASVKGYGLSAGSYAFGVHGNGGSSSRSGGVLGYGSSTALGALGYFNSGSVYYNVYGFGTAYQTGSSGGRMMEGSGGDTPWLNNTVGLGIYGGVMGGWIRGLAYGTHVKGEIYSLYVDGKTYTNDVITQLHDNEGSERIPTYVATSTNIDITERGIVKMENGRAFVHFSEAYQKLVSEKDPIIVTATPSGPSKGVYVESVGKGGFTIVENEGGNSTVTISWIAIGSKAGYESINPAAEVLSADYDKNMNGVMYNDYDKGNSATPIWWDGKTVRHDMPPKELTEKPIEDLPPAVIIRKKED